MIGAKAKTQALISNQSCHADRNRCPDSLTFGTIGTCRLAEWATVIPLLNTAAGHGYPERREIFASGTLKNQGTQKISEVAAAVVRIPWSGSFVTTGATSVEMRSCRNFYLRAAQAYMLISMPTGTSTIFGVFQAISDLLSGGTAGAVPKTRIGPDLR
jgi:hypothetical protein